MRAIKKILNSKNRPNLYLSLFFSLIRANHSYKYMKHLNYIKYFQCQSSRKNVFLKKILTFLNVFIIVKLHGLTNY